MGETNILSLDDYGNANLLLAQQTALGQAATIQSLSFYVATASGRLRLGIYDATGPNGGPGALKAQTPEITPIAGWNTATVTTPASLPVGTYWLAYLANSNSLHFRRAGSGSYKMYTYAYRVMPSTYPTSMTSGSDHSVVLCDATAIVFGAIPIDGRTRFMFPTACFQDEPMLRANEPSALSIAGRDPGSVLRSRHKITTLNIAKRHLYWASDNRREYSIPFPSTALASGGQVMPSGSEAWRSWRGSWNYYRSTVDSACRDCWCYWRRYRMRSHISRHE